MEKGITDDSTSLKCDPLVEIFLEQIRARPIMQMDETRVQVMKELGRADSALSFMWVMRGGPPQTPVILHRYHSSRNASIPL
jgi:transposase